MRWGGLAWFRPDAPPQRGSTGGEWPDGVSLGLAVAAGEVAAPCPVEWANPGSHERQMRDTRCFRWFTVAARRCSSSRAPRHCSPALTIDEGHKLRLALRLAGVTQARAAGVLNARQTQLSSWMALGKGPERVTERLEAAFGFRTDSLVDGCARRVGNLLCHGYKALGAQWCAACAMLVGGPAETERGWRGPPAQLRQLRKVRGGPGAAPAGPDAVGKESASDRLGGGGAGAIHLHPVPQRAPPPAPPLSRLRRLDARGARPVSSLHGVTQGAAIETLGKSVRVPTEVFDTSRRPQRQASM